MTAFPAPAHNLDVESAVHAARAYAVEMNAWERAFAEEWGAHARTYVHGAPPTEMQVFREKDEDIQRRYREQYRAIFARLGTPRERKYGGPDGPLSAGTPTKFAGLDADTPATAEIKSRNRVEVTFGPLDRGPALPQDLLFVVLRRGGAWRVDSYKHRLSGAHAWTNGIL